VYVVPADQYLWVGKRNDDDYLEHEVVMELGRRDTSHWLESLGGDDTKTTMRLKNEFLLDASVPARLDEQGDNGRNPPWRLDPLQNIINCNLGGLAVKFLDRAA
jgi:hypothetical protein